MAFAISLIIFSTLLLMDFAASAEITDFEELARAYADNAAKKCGTTVRFVDLYAKHKPEMEDKYNKYKIDVKFENMKYSTEVKKIKKPGNVYTQNFRNGQSVAEEGVFKKTVQIKKSFTWKVTSKVSVQSKVEVKVSVPAIVEASGSVSTTLEMSGEVGKTEESTETVEQIHTLTIPPKTRVKATLVVTEQEMDIPWSADIVITGSFAFWLEEACGRFDPNDKHHLWFPSVEVLANDKFRWVPNRGLIYKTKGTFRSVMGMSSDLKVKEFDYPKKKLGKRSENEKPRKKYTIRL